MEGKKQLALAKGEEWPPKKDKKSGNGGKAAAAAAGGEGKEDGEPKLTKKQLRILQKQKEAVRGRPGGRGGGAEGHRSRVIQSLDASAGGARG